MYLLYLDASGTPEIADTAHASFVLLGLAIHESTWFDLEKRVAALKAKYEFRESGHQWGSLQHVIETPFFVDSKIVSGIQLADVCGYALRRYIAKNERAGSHEEKQLLRIFHKFDRAGPKLHGLRHYCPARSCDCMVCEERGHA